MHVVIICIDTVQRRFTSTWWQLSPTVCRNIRKVLMRFISRLKLVTFWQLGKKKKEYHIYIDNRAFIDW